MNKKHHTGNKKQNAGFTLLEVLIALLILSVGLLGLASLQTRGLATGHNAYLRGQAVLLTQDMAERIRANSATSGNEYVVSYDKTSNGSDTCIITSCNSGEMATFDIDQWLKSLQDTLPDGEGLITKDGLNYQITVRWDDTAATK